MNSLVFGLRQKLGMFFYEELFNYAFLVSIFPALIFVLAQLVIDLFHPFYFQLRGLTIKPVDSSKLVKNFKEFCSQFKLEKHPSISISDVSYPFSLGFHKGKSMIIIPEFLQSFTSDELKSIVAHELWHIKTDVEAVYLRLFEIVSTASLTLTCGFTFLSVMFEHSVLGWWTKEVSVEIVGAIVAIDLYFENLFWIIFLSIVFPICFRILIRVLRAFTGFPVYLHYDHREHLADLCGSLYIEKPETMARTIKKTKRYASISETFQGSLLSKIGFVNPISKVKSSKKRGKKIPLTNKRIVLLDILDKSLNSNIKIIWKRKPEKLTTKLLLNFIFFASRISYGNVFSAIPREQQKRLIKFLWNNRANFNLKDCAQETETALENSLLVFYYLLRQDIIEVPEII